MFKRSIPTVCLTVMLAALALFTSARVALAANQVVSDCRDNGGANQLRAKLNAAQNTGGGTVTFTCGPSIVLDSARGILPDITTNTTINGGGTITISGNNATQIFHVTPGAALTLNNITIANGYANNDGGAIFNDGTLNINSSKFLNNEIASSGSGGAIFTDGALHITNSEFANNKASNGGALMLFHSGAVTTITGSNFHDNRATDTTDGWGGAILVFDGASATVNSSTFSKNKARHGGAVYVYANASVTLQNNSTLTANEATLGGSGVGNGGGIYNDGTIMVTKATLGGNKAENYGGGIYNNGTAALTHVTVSGNQTGLSGGGIYNDKNATLTHVTLNGNSAVAGGGITDHGSSNKLTNVTLSGNLASNGGGLVANGNTGSSQLTNVTLSGNSASMFGSGIYAPFNDNLELKNTLIAKGALSGNCYSAAGVGTFSLSDDNTCGFGAGRDNVANLNLGPLANSPGPASFTKTHLPGAGSAAIDKAQCTDFLGNPVTTDQRGISRPQGLACDVGAVELTPSEVCNIKPPNPTLRKPANGATLTKSSVKLKWQSTNCAEKYKITVRRDTQNGPKVAGGKTTETKFKIGGLTEGHTYHWFVKACNPPYKCSKSKWSSFYVSMTP